MKNKQTAAYKKLIARHMIDISHFPIAFESSHIVIQEIILFYPVNLGLRFAVCITVRCTHSESTKHDEN